MSEISKNSEMSKTRWDILMTHFGFACHHDVLNKLLKLHAQRHRAYHTAEHISACLKHLDATAHLTQRPKEIELAFWFHDAIYKPFSSTNEEDSAELAREFLISAGAKSSLIDRVVNLILITKDHKDCQNDDEKIMLDIDLAILGAPANIYDIYEKNIRREYRLVPRPIYRKKRKEILKNFLIRPRLYQHNHFHALWDKQASDNLARAISQL